MADQLNQEFFGGLWPALAKIKRIHFVGIAGSGMSGIAEVLHNLGYQITGSDIADNAIVARLKNLGINVMHGHHAEHVSGADVVVKSTAVADDNPEIATARDARIPVVPRAEMLAELMRFRYGIAVAGTHGKTTTTSLIASLLAEGGIDPTYVIGGQLNSAGVNAKLGAGRYLVAEADESDASFLHLQPMMSVVTNIDRDHMSTYGSFDRLRDSFLEFLHHMPFYGMAVVCVDDPVVAELLPKISRTTLTYGLVEQADVRAINLKYKGQKTQFDLRYKDDKKLHHFELNLPGEHNVLNALAAIGVAMELGLSIKVIQKGLAEFEGIARRFQQYGEIKTKQGEVLYIDDYAHHPTEINAVLGAVRAGWPQRRIVLAFQPHRYTRTQDLFDDFVKVLSSADVLFLLQVYAAGEPVIDKVDGQALCKAIQVKTNLNPIFVEKSTDLADLLPEKLRHGDVLITMGAGDIGGVAADLAQRLAV